METEDISQDEEKQESPSGKGKKGRKEKKTGEGNQPSIMSMFAKV